MALSVAATSTFFQGTALKRPSHAARRTHIKYEWQDSNISSIATPHKCWISPARQVVAKYDTQEGKYFDLKDLEDTVGSWDMYGSDADKQRYNGLQAEFFSRATQPLSRRSSLLAFTAGVGALSVLVWGAKGAKDAKLPITVGPQNGGEKGPRGKI